MKPQVYIETTVVSYYASRPSRDLVVAAHQELTHEWWDGDRVRYAVFCSEIVRREAARGDAEAAGKRLATLEGVPVLSLEEEALGLAARLTERGLVPVEYGEDALHIALAVIHGMDYLLTWNCRHIASARMRLPMIHTVEESGYECPSICTPEELMESDR